LLFVRSYANPSKDDSFFPVYRHKDWFQGSSWASGVFLPPYYNGKNEESSSEAIASYEAVGLFGETMYQIWKGNGDTKLAETSKEIMSLGKLMAATEIRSTHWYWQVRKQDENKQLYPEGYGHNVLGILWSTMAQFGTWFGNNPEWIYGIQLLPLTPIAEYRDDLSWLNEMYYPLSQACYLSPNCPPSGWGILRLAVLATIGYPEVALPQVLDLPRDAFLQAGGNGQSRTNTLWYIATRPEVTDRVPLDTSDMPESIANRPPPPPSPLTDCHVPETCTANVLDSDANGYTCRQRMVYLITEAGYTERAACTLVARDEYPDPCSPCDPDGSLEVTPPLGETTVAPTSRPLAATGAPTIQPVGTEGETPGIDVPQNGCHVPDSCTDAILDSMAGEYTCRARIQWLINQAGLSEHDACYRVSVDEFPDSCGPCNPDTPVEEAPPVEGAIDCHVPESCTNAVLDSMADAFTCRARIQYLINGGLPERDACYRVAVDEHPDPCGPCDPTVKESPPPADDQLVDCHVPETCTAKVLDSIANVFTCRARMEYLIAGGLSQSDACYRIAVEEHPDPCGPCNPDSGSIQIADIDSHGIGGGSSSGNTKMGKNS
jgi:hypothetical protein